MFDLATVATTAPLTVRTTGSSTPLPAKVAVVGYSPAVNARVTVFVASGRLYVLGPA